MIKMLNSVMQNLTSREMEVLHLVNTGKLNKEIAKDLTISIETVKKHIKSIYKKLEVRNRAEAIIYMANYAGSSKAIVV